MPKKDTYRRFEIHSSLAYIFFKDWNCCVSNSKRTKSPDCIWYCEDFCIGPGLHHALWQRRAAVLTGQHVYHSRTWHGLVLRVRFVWYTAARRDRAVAVYGSCDWPVSHSTVRVTSDTVSGHMAFWNLELLQAYWSPESGVPRPYKLKLNPRPSEVFL